MRKSEASADSDSGDPAKDYLHFMPYMKDSNSSEVQLKDKMMDRDMQKREREAQEKLFREFLLFLKAREVIRKERERKDRKRRSKTSKRHPSTKDEGKDESQDAHPASAPTSHGRADREPSKGPERSEREHPQSAPSGTQRGDRPDSEGTKEKETDGDGGILGKFFRRGSSKDDNAAKELENERGPPTQDEKAEDLKPQVSVHSVPENKADGSTRVVTESPKGKKPKSKRQSRFLTALMFGKQPSGYEDKPPEAQKTKERSPPKDGVPEKDLSFESTVTIENNAERRSYFFKTMRPSVSKKLKQMKEEATEEPCSALEATKSDDCPPCKNWCRRNELPAVAPSEEDKRKEHLPSQMKNRKSETGKKRRLSLKKKDPKLSREFPNLDNKPSNVEPEEKKSKKPKEKRRMCFKKSKPKPSPPSDLNDDNAKQLDPIEEGGEKKGTGKSTENPKKKQKELLVAGKEKVRGKGDIPAESEVPSAKYRRHSNSPVKRNKNNESRSRITLSPSGNELAPVFTASNTSYSGEKGKRKRDEKGKEKKKQTKELKDRGREKKKKIKEIKDSD